jgi:hypothetical protein
VLALLCEPGKQDVRESAKREVTSMLFMGQYGTAAIGNRSDC